MLFLLLYGLHFRKMSIHLTVKQKVNSTFIQSWECGVARKVLKCTKHLYISMCICVIKERLLKASLSSWCHYNQAYFLRTDASIENTKDQLRVLAVQMSYFLTCRPERSYSEKCFNNFSYGLFHSWILLQVRFMRKEKALSQINFDFLVSHKS